jgi:NADH-quinone oxidoreductase subunit G
VMRAPAVLMIGNNPTDQHPLLAWNVRTNVRLQRGKLYLVNSYSIKLRRQATQFAQIAPGAEAQFVRFLNGDDSAAGGLGTEATTRESLIKLRDALRAEQGLVIIFGSELRGNDVAALVKFGADLGAKFICLGDHANSRGAADMGLYPDLLPGYAAGAAAQRFGEEWGAPLPSEPGMHLQEMMHGAKDGKIRALHVVGSNPILRYKIDPFLLSNTFLIVQDMFLTETAELADVVLPPANAYEKDGTFTNTCGDLQMLRKAGDVSTVKADFEIIVRIADAMGFDVRRLVPFGDHAVRADLGQSRGAQSGEADRHAIWLDTHGLVPKVSPFDPMAVLDEIQRLVPGYDISRLNLIAGSDEHTQLHQIRDGFSGHDPSLILPNNDTLFTSGTMTKYSSTLNSVVESRRSEPADKEVAAD